MGAGASRVESSRACDASVAVAMRARMGMPFVRGMKVWLRRGHTRTSPVRRYQYRIGDAQRGAVDDDDDDDGGDGGGGEGRLESRPPGARVERCARLRQKKSTSTGKKHNRKSTSPPRINISLLRAPFPPTRSHPIPLHPQPAPTAAPLFLFPPAFLASPPSSSTAPAYPPAPRTIPGHRAPHVIFTSPRPDSIPDWPSEARVRQAHALGTPRRPPPPSSPASRQPPAHRPPAVASLPAPPRLGSRAPFLSPSALGPPPTTVRALPLRFRSLVFIADDALGLVQLPTPD